tara:strand:+ start:1392 stop:2381 length:990 start_codon:yes stop_codon:yes gene_type:complete
VIIKSYLAEADFKKFNYKILLIYGENLGLKQEFKNKIKSEYNEVEIFEYNQDEIFSIQEKIFVNLFNISLFKKRKIFVINQCTDKVLDFVEKIEDKLEDQKIFLFADRLDKKSKVRSFFEKSKNSGAIACYEDNEITLRNIVQKKLKGFKSLTTENINILVENCGLDRMKLINELEKVVSYFEKKEINTKELEELLNIKNIDDFNLIKDAAICGDRVNTNKLLNDTLMENEKNILYLSMINQRLNKIKDAKNLSLTTDIEETMSVIKPPIFWKDKPVFLKQSKKWNLKKINFALDKTYNIEVTFKSNSTIIKNCLIKKLLIDICNLANA